MPLDVKLIVQSYIDYSNDCDYNSMADLFDENADWIPIEPIEPRKGKEAIRAGYLDHVKSQNKPITNAIYYIDNLTCIVEFDVQVNENKKIKILDIFKFNETGQIISLSVYRK